MIVATRDLTRRFGAKTAVDRISLSVHEGDLYGFLGPNGSGKTTTIRMLLGLIERSEGEIRIFGHELRERRLEILAQVGALVEEPAFYPYLSGRRNLDVMARLLGGVPRGRIDEVLDAVSLRHRADDLVRVYSQGMRQRLGIAQALLGQPRLLFLDEPTNGLDPPGIEEMRKLLHRLAREEKITVFVSSHLLHEVELLCNRLAILSQGRLLVEGETKALLGAATVRLDLAVEGDAAPLRAALAGLGHADATSGETPGSVTISTTREAVPALIRALVEKGIPLSQATPRRPTLEEYFRARIAEGSAASPPAPPPAPSPASGAAPVETRAA